MELAERAVALPTAPGVYLFKNERGRVLYVGKAQNLRARVRSYLGGGDGRPRRSRVWWSARVDVDVVVTRSVKDALLLENELIKRHKPPFNVRLRDDKQYLGPAARSARPTWPRLTQVRRFRDDGAHYFGPYTSSAAMRDAVAELLRVFPLRSCSNGTCFATTPARPAVHRVRDEALRRRRAAIGWRRGLRPARARHGAVSAAGVRASWSRS